MAEPRALLVAAHPGDLTAAAACGLRTAYVHRPDEHGPGGSAEPPAAGAVDLVAGDLIELAGLLGT
jgi:2-haloacid dehalogenase